MLSKYVGVPLIALTIAMLTSCSEGGGGSEVGIGPVADFNDEVYAHSSWNTLSPVQERSNMPTGVMENGIEEIVGNDEYMCNTTQHSITDTPSEFISIQPDSSII